MSYTTHPSRRKQLNSEQLAILHILYKFRFATAHLLIAALDKPIGLHYLNVRLRILTDQGYIGRRYGASYRLQGKPASYYVLPKGITRLRQEPNKYSPKVLRAIQGDAERTDRSIQHWLNIFAVYAQLEQHYGNRLKFFTRSYLGGFDYFPKPLPDAYVSLGADESTQPKHYLIECFDESMTWFAMKKRVSALVAHAENGDWTIDAPYPTVVLLCYSEAMKKKVEWWVKRTLEDAWLDNLEIRVLHTSNFDEDAVKWAD